MTPALVVRAYGETNRGLVREGNEDSFFVGDTVFAVADGMGGHAAGEVASETALVPVSDLDGADWGDPQSATDALATAIRSANETVYKAAAENQELRGMGTTLTAVLLRDGRLHLAHVGDSRAYLYRDSSLQPLTRDHTLVQQLIDEGRLTPAQAQEHPHRSVITRAIGVDSAVEVDTNAPLELLPGDQVLLCSDGLTGPVEEPQIAAILRTERDGNAACAKLLDAANANGGPDNITVVLLRVDGNGGGTATAELAPPGDDDATQELPAAAAAAAASGTARTPVAAGARSATGNVDRTQSFDPRALRSLSQGTVDDTPPELRDRRRRRFASGLLAGALLVAILGVGGWLLVNRAYFVGLDGDEVVVFRGLDQELLGLRLSSIAFTSDVTTDDLPPRLVRQLEDGVPQGSLADAVQYIDTTLRGEAAGAATATPPPPASAAATAAATAAPAPSATAKDEPALDTTPAPRPAPAPTRT